MVSSWLFILAFARLDGGAAWDYKKNGADWGLEPGLCGAGSGQSPIDLPTTAEIDKEDAIYLKYPKIGATLPLYHNGYSIAATLPESFKAGFGISDKGPEQWEVPGLEAYRLWQMNFHAPSEHTINGERMPLEVQLMHKRVTGGSEDDSDVAVIVVLFQSTANEYGTFLDSIITNGLPQKAWEEVQLNAVTHPLNLGELVGGSPYYTYKGSLTTPPCESKVKYYVRQDPVPAARMQLKQFENVLWNTCGPNGNYRLTKDLSGPLNLIASVDMVNSPGLKVKPEEKAAVFKRPGTSKEFRCQKELDNFEHDASTLMARDSQELITAKEGYHFRAKEVQAALTAAARFKRETTHQQKLYDEAPGMVNKMQLKWNLIVSQDAHKAAVNGLAERTANHDKAKANLVKIMMKECVKRLQAKEDEAAGELLSKEDQAKAAAEAAEDKMVDKIKAEKFKYSKPTLELPVGVEASPFSDAVGTAKNAGASAAMIAPNLQQPEMAPGAAMSPADGQGPDKVPEALNDPNVIMTMKLPIPLAKLGKDQLIEALAESAHVDPSRLEVEDIHEASVRKVVTTADAYDTQTSLLQSGGRMRGSARAAQAHLSSEQVQVASPK